MATVVKIRIDGKTYEVLRDIIVKSELNGYLKDLIIEHPNETEFELPSNRVNKKFVKHMIECYKYNNFVEDRTNPAWDQCIKYMEIYDPNANEIKYSADDFILYFGQNMIKRNNGKIGHHYNNMFMPINTAYYNDHTFNLYVCHNDNNDTIVEILILLDYNKSNSKYKCYVIDINGIYNICNHHLQYIVYDLHYKVYEHEHKQQLSLFLWTLEINGNFIRNKKIEYNYNKYIT